MREEDVRGIFARTMDTPPVPANDTDYIIAAGRRRVRTRQVAFGGSTLAAVVAVVVGAAFLQGGGPAPSGEAPAPPVAYWDPTGPADPAGDYSDALALVVGEGLPGVEVDTVSDAPFVFAWNDDKTAIVSSDYLKLDGDDALYLDVTVQEPKPDADVDARLQELAGCADDCALADVSGGRLLTRQDQVVLGDLPRARHQAMIARADGTVATATLRVDDDSPGTIGLTMEQLTGIVAAIPDTTKAPVGKPAPSDDETKETGLRELLDSALEDAILAQLADATLTDNIDYEGFDELGFRYGETITGWRSDGTIVIPSPPNMDFTAEVYDPIADPLDAIETMAKCEAFGCDRSEVGDATVLTITTTQGGPNGEEFEVVSVWVVRSDDSIARLTVTAVEEAALPLSTEQVAEIALALPFL